jgi:hypothetical protein
LLATRLSYLSKSIKQTLTETWHLAKHIHVPGQPIPSYKFNQPCFNPSTSFHLFFNENSTQHLNHDLNEISLAATVFKEGRIDYLHCPLVKLDASQEKIIYIEKPQEKMVLTERTQVRKTVQLPQPVQGVQYGLKKLFHSSSTTAVHHFHNESISSNADSYRIVK